MGEFIRGLRAVRLRAGEPSLGELGRRTSIPASTLSDALNTGRRRLPSLELVRALLHGCGAEPAELAWFERAWYGLKQQQDHGAAPPRETAPPERGAPRQLPPLHGFSGRADYLAELDTAVPSITVITGTVGVGKTALAVHWAQQRAESFPDGQLFVDLHGHAVAPALDPRRALSLLLQSLGVAGESVPVDLEVQTGLLRSLMTGRRMLLVLDNARDAEQVRPLLPGTSSCHVLVTSRNTLGGLAVREGARQVHLGELSEAEALDLLAGRLGAERVAAEPEAARELVRLCACLPLALRIAAANLVGHPDQPLADFAAQLHGVNRLARLQVVDDPDAAVAGAFDLSYAVLSPEAKRAFRLIGLMPGPEISAPAIAVLAGLSPHEPVPALDSLAAANLLEPGGTGRFRCHDLVRLYAGRCARHELPAVEREAAVGRLQSWYLLTADAVAELHNPTMLRLPRTECQLVGTASEFASTVDAVSWLDRELPNLVALIEHAATAGPRWLSWHLVDALRASFYVSRQDMEWLACAQSALEAAQAEGDLLGIAATCNTMGIAASSRGELALSEVRFQRAAECFERVGFQAGISSALNNLGDVLHHAGQLRRAVDFIERSLSLEVNRSNQSTHLSNLAAIHTALGQPQKGLGYGLRAVAAAEQMRAGAALSYSLSDVAHVLCRLGRADESLGYLDRALTVARENSASKCELSALAGLALAYSILGRHDEAVLHARRVLSLAPGPESMGMDPQHQSCAIEALVAAGHFDEALAQAASLLVFYDPSENALTRARLHLLAGNALAARDGREAALEHWRSAREAYAHTDAPEAEALDPLLG
ncbi:ATP-binding protein [Streptomyces polyrhachis]|uniref:ATP-binding protein n=1 Tax=Streptomyces polyrhachis TaxID=1282885 RepID=A0ABW2GKV9_9ACTN